MAQNTPRTRQRRPWTPGEKALLIIILLVVALVGGGGLWWHDLNVPPVANVPNPTLPSPNAFDYFVHAGAQMKDEKATGDALSAKQGDKTAHIYTDAERAALVAENAPTLADVREGLQYPYYNPPARAFDTPFPYYAKFRAEARILSLDAQVKTAQGDHAGAVRSSLDAMQMGNMVPRGSPIIGGLVGIAIDAIGRRRVWKNIDHLTETEARAAAHRLETINAQRIPCADALQEEKWTGQASLATMFQKFNTFQLAGQVALMAGGGEDLGEGKGQFNGLMRHMAFRSKRRHFADYTQAMDDMIAYAKRPYLPNDGGPVLSDEPFVQMLVTIYPKARSKFDTAAMEDNLLTVAVALRAYHARHNDYPAGLDALVKDGILTRVPSDPFAPALNTPLRYRHNPNGTYALYSVGPDGRDDGGRPVKATQKNDPTKPRYFPEPDDKGDWVVGSNNYRD